MGNSMNLLTVVFISGFLTSLFISFIVFKKIAEDLESPTVKNRLQFAVLVFLLCFLLNCVLYLGFRETYILQVTSIKDDKIRACITKYDLFKTEHKDFEARMINGMIISEENIPIYRWERAITEYIGASVYENSKHG